MTRDEIKAAVAEGVAAAMANCAGGRCCATCDLKPLEHRDHHKALTDVGGKDLGEFYANNRFVREMRSAVQHGKKVFLAEFIKHAVTAFFMALAVYAALKGFKG